MANELRYTISGDPRDFERAMTRVDRRLAQSETMAGRFGKASSNAFGMLARGATTAAKAGVLGVGAAMVYSAKTAADFEQQISRLGAVSGANRRQMEDFRKAALKAGRDTAFSAREAAAAQTELAKGGLSVQQIMRGGLRSALALAAAGEMDLAEAASTTVNAMKLFGISGRDSMKVADAFATAANRTTADVSDFAMALRQGGSAAKAAGLSFEQTTTWLEALAEAGIKNSDAGTSMKAAIAQLVGPSEKQSEVTQQMGLNFFDAAGNMKSLAGISKELQKELGNQTRQQRLATIRTVAGTDGMRALLALYDAGPKKLRAMEAELSKQGTAADVARKKQDNLKGSLERLSGSIETLGIQAGTAMIPVIRRATDELDDFAGAVSKVADRKDLDLGEKIQLTASMARKRLRPLAKAVGQAIEDAHLGERFNDAMNKAMPKIIESMANHAPEAAGAFVKAFVGAGIWGRLLIGGFLLKKMGGFGAFRALGAQGAAAMGAGAAGVAGAGAAGGGIRGAFQAGSMMGRKPGMKGSVLGGLRGVGGLAGRGALGLVGGVPGIAAMTALTVGPELLKPFTQGSKKISTALEEIDAKARKASNGGLEAYRDKLRQVAATARRSASEGNKADAALASGVERLAERANNALGRQWQSNIRTAWKQFSDAGGHGIKRTKDVVDRNMLAIKQRIGEDTDAGRRAMAQNFREAARAIKTQMDKGEVSTKKGTGAIRGYLVEALRALGLTGAQAQAKVDTGTLNVNAGALGKDKQGRPVAGHVDRAGGGWIGRRGERGRDTVPALLGAGEAVLNAPQQAVIEAHLGTGFLDKLFSTVKSPHYAFASGGRIPRPRVLEPKGTLGSVSQQAINVDHREAERIYARKLAESVTAAAMGGGASSATGLVPQVKRALAWARNHGWHGVVSSGFRSRAKQEALYANRFNNPNPVAVPGTSNHERGRAVDITDTAGFQRAMANAPANARLIWFGPKDPVHWSVDGHARGGFVGRVQRFAGGGRAKYIFNYFRSKGFSNAQAAGFVGNFTQESGLDPSRKQVNGPGRGLVQWEGARRTALMAYAKKRGKPWTDLNTQLDFIMYELRGPEAVAYSRIKAAKGVTNATNVISSAYERPGIEGNRLGPARTAYNAFRTSAPRAKQFVARRAPTGGSSGGTPDRPTQLDRIQAGVDLAALTKGQGDDRAAADAAVKYWRTRLRRVRRRKHADPRLISEAAQGLAGARSSRRELRPSQPSRVDAINSTLGLAAAEAAMTEGYDDDLAANANQQTVVSGQLTANAAALRTARGARRTRLEGQRVGLLETLKGLQDAAQGFRDAAEEEKKTTMADLLAEMKVVSAALTEQNDRAARLANTQYGVLATALTEVVSGTIATGAASGARTPGVAANRWY